MQLGPRILAQERLVKAQVKAHSDRIDERSLGQDGWADLPAAGQLAVGLTGTLHLDPVEHVSPG